MKTESTDRPNETLNDALDALKNEHRVIEAPAYLEKLLAAEAARIAAPARESRLRPIWAWTAGAAVLACLLLSLLAWQKLHSNGAPEQRVQAVPHTAPAPLQALNPSGQSPERYVDKSARRQTRNRRRERSAPAFDDATLADFVPLPASEGLPTASEISLVRMRIEGSALQQYGLEIPVEAAPRTVLAEFAVGQDGLPRAIRIIQ